MLQLDPLNDGISSVQLVEYLGGDRSITQAARVSFANDLTVYTDERDYKLIRFLLKEGHGTPFESNLLKFRIKCPIFVDRHFVKYRAGVSKSEQSLRYTEVQDEFYIPNEFRSQSKSNRQASVEGGLTEQQQTAARKRVAEANFNALAVYKDLLRIGVAREQARAVLPLSTYVASYYTMNLRALLHILNQRDHKDAQYETRQFAIAMKQLAEPLFPMVFRALEEVRIEHDR